jgi:hypothetical protein
MLYTTYSVVFLITVSFLHPSLSHPHPNHPTIPLTPPSQIRIIFRLIEYASGFNAPIPKQEAYMYCLDSLPMFTCLVILNVVHPGVIMPGKESDLPSKKERRAKGGPYVITDDDMGNQLISGRGRV